MNANKLRQIPAYPFLIIAVLFKLWLMEAIPLYATVFASHDGTLFQKIAISIISGEWLGEYGPLILTKGVGYPLWVAFTWFFSIPLRFANELLYVLSLLVFYRLMVLLSVGKVFSVLSFVVLLFNPATLNTSFWGSFIRQNIYFSLCAMAVFALCIFFFYLHKKNQCQTRWIILSGFALAYAWITREETIWIVPLYCWAFVLSVFFLRKTMGTLIKSTLILVVPASMTFLMITAVSTINQQYYDFYGTNEFKTNEFTSAWNAIAGVKPDTGFVQYIPLREDVLEKIYKVSPAAKALKPYFDEAKGKIKVAQTDDGTIHGWHGTFAHWTFISAAAKAGYYDESMKETRAYYQRLADEINAACDSGQLDCVDSLYSMSFWHETYNQQIVPKFQEVITRLFRFKPLSVELRENTVIGDSNYRILIDGLAHRNASYPNTREGIHRLPAFQLERIQTKTRTIAEILQKYHNYAYKLFWLALLVTLFYLVKTKDEPAYKRTIGFVLTGCLGSIFTISCVTVLLAITAYNTYARISLTATPYYLVIICLLFISISRMVASRKTINMKKT